MARAWRECVMARNEGIFWWTPQPRRHTGPRGDRRELLGTEGSEKGSLDIEFEGLWQVWFSTDLLQRLQGRDRSVRGVHGCSSRRVE